MRMLATSASVLAVLLFITASPDASTSDTPEELVAKLGSAKFKEREAASAALDKLGEAALPALRAGLKNPEAEVRSRAFTLLQRIEYRVESARALAGTKVRLNYKDVPLGEALKDIADKTALSFLLDPNDATLQDRKITLDTGDTTLWDAMEQLCRTAGIDERRIDALSDKSGMLNLRHLVVPTPANVGPTFIGLTDAKGSWAPAIAFGGVRMRVLGANERSRTSMYPVPRPGPTVVGFVLEVTPEPTMTWQSVTALRVAHALDENGQKLVQPETYLLERFPDPFFGMGVEAAGIGIWTDDTSLGLHDTTPYRHVVARFLAGAKPSKMLKEVRGTVTAEILTKQTLVAIDDPAASTNMDHSGPGGVMLRIDEIKRQGQDVTLSLRVSYKRGLNWLRQGILVRTDGGGNMHVDPMLGQTSFTLRDSGGKELVPTNLEHVEIANHQGDPCLWAGYVLKFTLPSQETSLGSLRYNGMRLMTVDVPFELREVPLCEDPSAPAPSTILHRSLWKGGL